MGIIDYTYRRQAVAANGIKINLRKLVRKANKVGMTSDQLDRIYEEVKKEMGIK